MVEVEVPKEETAKYGIVKGDILDERTLRMTGMVEKPKPVENNRDINPIKIIDGDFKPLKIITYAKQFENKNELRKVNPTAYTKIQKMGLMDKAFPPENIE
mgnify:CR=1 FL=1